MSISFSISYTNFPHFFFQIKCISALLPLLLLCTMVNLSDLITLIVGCFLDYLLDMFLKDLHVYLYFITCFGDLYNVFIILRFLDVRVWFWLSRKGYVYYDYKLHFPIRSFNPFFKQNSVEISIKLLFYVISISLIIIHMNWFQTGNDYQ